MKEKKHVSKADAIRQVASQDMSLTNKQIREKVRRRYGYTVESNQIINLIGSYASRRFGGKAGPAKLRMAREFVARIGSIREAVQLLHLSQALRGRESNATMKVG